MTIGDQQRVFRVIDKIENRRQRKAAGLVSGRVRVKNGFAGIRVLDLSLT